MNSLVFCLSYPQPADMKPLNPIDVLFGGMEKRGPGGNDHFMCFRSRLKLIGTTKAWLLVQGSSLDTLIRQ